MALTTLKLGGSRFSVPPPHPPPRVPELDRQERPKGLLVWFYFPLFMTLALLSLIVSYNLQDGNPNSLEEVKEEYARMYSESDR